MEHKTVMILLNCILLDILWTCGIIKCMHPLVIVQTVFWEVTVILTFSQGRCLSEILRNVLNTFLRFCLHQCRKPGWTTSYCSPWHELITTDRTVMHHPPESASCVLLGLGWNSRTACWTATVHSAAAGWIMHSTLYAVRDFLFVAVICIHFHVGGFSSLSIEGLTGLVCKNVTDNNL